jgi:hypothetical protein
MGAFLVEVIGEHILHEDPAATMLVDSALAGRWYFLRRGQRASRKSCGVSGARAGLSAGQLRPLRSFAHVQHVQRSFPKQWHAPICCCGSAAAAHGCFNTFFAFAGAIDCTCAAAGVWTRSNGCGLGNGPNRLGSVVRIVTWGPWSEYGLCAPVTKNARKVPLLRPEAPSQSQ